MDKNPAAHKERRRFPRVEVGILVSLDHKALGDDQDFMTHDLSRGGLCVWVPISQERYWAAFGAIDNNDIPINLPTSRGDFMEVMGRVVWINRDLGRVGIEFYSLNRKEEANLQQILSSN